MAAVVTFATSTLAEGAVRQRLPVRLPTVGVLALFRDEAMYLTEWLTHYAAEGVTQFVLLENQLSVDNSVELVHRFAQQNPWLNVSLHTAREPRQQNRHYARHLHRVTTDWVLIVDLDEFAYARRGSGSWRYRGRFLGRNTRCGIPSRSSRTPRFGTTSAKTSYFPGTRWSTSRYCA